MSTPDRKYWKKTNYPSIGSQSSDEESMVPADARFHPNVMLYEQVQEAIDRNTKLLASALEIPQLMRESAFDATGSATILTTTPQSSNMFLVTNWAVFVPSGASGLLTLAELQIPVGAGLTVQEWYQALNPDDVRQLAITGGGGTMSFVLMGTQMSRRSLFR